MVILSIGSQFPPNNGGNASRVSSLVEEYAKLGHKVIVCTITPEERRDFDKEYFENNGIVVHRYSTVKSMLLDLKAKCIEHDVDVIYSHTEITWFYSTLTLNKLPVIYECHSIRYSKGIKQIIKNIGFFLARNRTKGIFVLSNNAKKYFVSQLGYSENKIHFTPNGFDSRLENERIAFNENQNFVYAYGGTLYDWQGIIVLLQQCKDILDISEDIRIKIVGGGPLLDYVKKYVVEHNIQDKVEVTGSVDKDKFEMILNAVDVLLIPRPSTIETETAIPLKIFDAVKLNKPIVMSDVSGLTEVLSNKEALIYDNKTPEKIVGLCRKIYRNTELAVELTEAAREKVSRWPSTQDIARRQVGIFERVVYKER